MEAHLTSSPLGGVSPSEVRLSKVLHAIEYYRRKLILLEETPQGNESKINAINYEIKRLNSLKEEINLTISASEME